MIKESHVLELQVMSLLLSFFSSVSQVKRSLSSPNSFSLPGLKIRMHSLLVPSITSTCSMEEAAAEACMASNDSYLAKYSYLVWGVCLSYVINTLLLVPARIRASRVIHKDLSEKILAAPVAFFDVTPVGRILNRFNKDMVSQRIVLFIP